MFIQESKIFSIRKETFLSRNIKLYMLYQPEIKKTKNIKLITLIKRKKKIKVDMRTDLLCNRNMLVVDIQEKTKNEKKKFKLLIYITSRTPEWF